MGSNLGTCAYVGRTLSTELNFQLHKQIIATFNYIILRTRNVYPTQSLVAVWTQLRRSHWEWCDQFIFLQDQALPFVVKVQMASNMRGDQVVFCTTREMTPRKHV